MKLLLDQGVSTAPWLRFNQVEFESAGSIDRAEIAK